MLHNVNYVAFLKKANVMMVADRGKEVADDAAGNQSYFVTSYFQGTRPQAQGWAWGSQRTGGPEAENVQAT